MTRSSRHAPSRLVDGRTLMAAVPAAMRRALLALLLLLPIAALAQTPADAPAPVRGVPSDRAADNVVVIRISGHIDSWTARAVQRRIAEAAASRADALVFELDSVSSRGHTASVIAGMIRSSPISNTVAWVHPSARSGAAIIALACREIVPSADAVLGDASPTSVGRMTRLSNAQGAAEKGTLPVVLTDVLFWARTRSYDEALMQAMVRPAELWMVEHASTGERLLVTEKEFAQATGSLSPPPRGTPVVGTSAASPGRKFPAGRSVPSRPGPPRTTVPTQGGLPTDFAPVIKDLSPPLVAEVNKNLAVLGVPTQRPDFSSPEHAGKYTPAGYFSDGNSVVMLSAPQLAEFQLTGQIVNSDEELKQFFGASRLVRLDENALESLARLLSHPVLKGLLIVLFLVTFFIEMLHPGMIIPGTIAAICFIAIVLPTIIAGLTGWISVAAILLGIILIAFELLIAPGIGIFAILGAVLLFGGLIGTFVTGQSLFPVAGQASSIGRELTIGLTVTVTSLIIAGAGVGLLLRSVKDLPFVSRFVHKGVSGEPPPESMLEAMAVPVDVKAGERGVAVSPLRPSGRVQLTDLPDAPIVDAVSDGAFIDAGTRVRVVSSTPFRTVVEVES